MASNELRNLLTSWRCDILVNLLKEEEITIEDLKIIKYHHVVKLLQPYKMSIRIRFEYFLEKWRNKLGKPLEGMDWHNPYFVQAYNGGGGDYAGRNSGHSAEATGRSLTTLPNDSSTQVSPVHELNARAHDGEDSNERLDTGMRQIAAKNPYPLSMILQKCAQRAEPILNYYEAHQAFTNNQRLDLIHLICDFFRERNIAMSLAMSHELERDILKRFPSEKLHDYRIEKRGKIFIKYNNRRRHKRAKRGPGEGPKIAKMDQDMRYNNNNGEMAMKHDVNEDSWPEMTDEMGEHQG